MIVKIGYEGAGVPTCYKCGMEIPDGKRVCPSCGSEHISLLEVFIIAAWGVLLLFAWFHRYDYPILFAVAFVLAGSITIGVITAARYSRLPDLNLLIPGAIGVRKIGCLILATIVCPVIVVIIALWLG